MSSYRHETKAKIVAMLDASEGKHRSKWDIADEAMQIVFDAYMVSKTQDYLLECAEYFEGRQDCEVFTVTANTILNQVRNPIQMQALKHKATPQ